MISCPACRRRVFTYREMLVANIEGWSTCPVCGQVARLDGLSRTLVGCTLGLLLWYTLYRGELFFSGYLFAFSTLFIIGGWRVVAAALLPLLAIEKAPDGFHLNRRQSMAMFAIIVVVAVAVDGLLSYRSPADKAEAAAAAQRMDTSPR